MDKKITIGFFMDSYFPMVDGVTVLIDNYAKRLIKYANVVVFVPRIPKKEFDDSTLPYKVVRCTSKKIPFLDYQYPFPRFDKKFMKELEDTKLDLIHIHSPFPMGKLGIWYGKKKNIPVLATMHTQFKLEFDRYFHNKIITYFMTKSMIKALNKCDECWAVNSETAKLYYEDYGYKELPKVMNNATDMNLLEDVEGAKALINEKHNISPEDKVFLFVGRIDELKNIMMTANSLKIVKEKSDLKFKMIYVGDGRDEKMLKDWISKNNMEDQIIMAGRVMDRELLAKYYARADLFLFPSTYDASSIVQIEAASQKTPTLFVEGSPTTATITKDVNGFICENDVEKFADKIIEIMNDPEHLKEVSENAYKEVYINWDQKVQEVFESYKRIIKESKEK